MWIHLFRHGIAIDRDDPACPTDPERFLTPKGVERTRAAAKGLATLAWEVDAVITSPYRRARETADLAMEALKLKRVPRTETDALVPMAEPAELIAQLKDTEHEEILLVGHAPNLDRVAAFLVGSDRTVTSLKKAGAASVEIHSPGFGGGILHAVYPPAVLRRL